MTTALVSAVLELLELGLRVSDTPAEVEKYIALRKKLREELVEKALSPPPPSASNPVRTTTLPPANDPAS